MRKDIKDAKLDIKVIETSGLTVKKVLQKSNPYKKKRCVKEDCLICRTEGRGKCKKNGYFLHLPSTYVVLPKDGHSHSLPLHSVFTTHKSTHMLIFAEGGKPENPEKNPRDMGENNV